MAKLEQTVDEPVADVRGRVGAYAASQGWEFREDRSSDDAMVFRNGVTLASFGQWVTVTLTPVADAQTEVSVSTKPAGVQLVDWGQGKKLARQLLAELNGPAAPAA